MNLQKIISNCIKIAEDLVIGTFEPEYKVPCFWTAFHVKECFNICRPISYQMGELMIIQQCIESSIVK
jgi:hypothetical protein